MLKIHIPRNGGIYRSAADELSSMWRKVTGKKLPITLKDDGKSDLIILGSDAVNPLTHAKIIEKVIPQFKIRRDTDDYQLCSAQEHGRKLLFIAGGRPRALFYGIYHFFELKADCRYFWDGDIIPHRENIPINGIDLCESPRFEYRGLRYFAHRSLNRFQAEHWDFAEWKQEIDWILKKRLNLFMLRIGLDDLFQKAFPEVVKDHGYEVPESIRCSYDDRTLFWSMEYRSELRKKILDYAKERDLLHPEDVGTMTHWYSRTPNDFLNHFKPDFLPQATNTYSEKTGLVWDIREEENLDRYFHLTETHIREYGSANIFHTIGLAERKCYPDHISNHQMKLYTYRRIIGKLREKYPNAPLLVGSWDFATNWSPEEVRSLLAELNPANTLIFDYTSDTSDELNNFLNWGIVNRFPWIFGLFHAYEPTTELRGNYKQLENRLPVAARDPMCRGLVYWPESSHTDTLMLDFMPLLAWDPSDVKIDDFLPEFCRRRYTQNGNEMFAIWKKAMPVIKLTGWPGPQDKMKLPVAHSDFIFKVPSAFLIELHLELLNSHRILAELFAPLMPEIPELFRMLSKMAKDPLDKFIRRDLIDLGRTAVSRIQNFGFSKLMLSIADWRGGKCPRENIFTLLKAIVETVKLEADLLDAHEDYSLNDSLALLKKKHETNPYFENTLKGNAENGYCRSYISELFKGIYIPEIKAYADYIKSRINAGDHSDWGQHKAFDEQMKAIRDHFYETPLKQLAPDHGKASHALSGTLKKLAAAAEQIIR